MHLKIEVASHNISSKLAVIFPMVNLQESNLSKERLRKEKLVVIQHFSNLISHHMRCKLDFLGRIRKLRTKHLAFYAILQAQGKKSICSKTLFVL